LVNEKALTAPPRVEYESEVGFGRLAPILENTIYRIAQSPNHACQHSHSGFACVWFRTAHHAAGGL
jgi:hypothetical protein